MKYSKILFIYFFCTQLNATPTTEELRSAITRIEIDWSATKITISARNDALKQKYGNAVQYWEKPEFTEEPGVTGIGLIFDFKQKFHCIKEYTFYRENLLALKITCSGEYKYRRQIQKILSSVKYEIAQGVSIERQESSHITRKIRYIGYTLLIESEQIRNQMLDDSDYRVKRAVEIQAKKPKPNKNSP